MTFSPDLNNRIDTITFEANPEEKIEELIKAGEDALNITINIKEEIVNLSKGSFHIAQMLCKETCINSDIIHNQEDTLDTKSSIEIIKDNVFNELARIFYPKARAFAIGSKIRKEGRAPYLHLLHWLAESPEWTIQINEMLSQHPQMKLSISQVVEKGHLTKLINDNLIIQDVIHYDPHSNILSVEDPKFLFYIRSLLWNKFAKKVGFIGINFTKPYDFALSFAGEDRELANLLQEKLLEREISVFYDKNEQHRILSSNVEEYLAPIYKSEADFIIVLLSSTYPKKIWTKFESDNFKERFGDNAIIPIWFTDAPPGIFDESRKYGGLTYDSKGDLETQAESIVEVLVKKITEYREEMASKDSPGEAYVNEA